MNEQGTSASVDKAMFSQQLKDCNARLLDNMAILTMRVMHDEVQELEKKAGRVEINQAIQELKRAIHVGFKEQQEDFVRLKDIAAAFGNLKHPTAVFGTRGFGAGSR